MLRTIEFWISLVTGLLSLLTFLYITVGGNVFHKTIRLKTVGLTGVEFRVLLKDFNVQQITNIVSAYYFGGGQVPMKVRYEIIELTAGHGIKSCRKQLLKTNAQNNRYRPAPMFINLSNHPSEQWQAEQAAAATAYGPVVDLSFPDVNPDGDEQYIAELADEYLQKIFVAAQGCGSVTVHLMGEMNFTFAMLQRLRQHNIECVASTTQRLVKDMPDGSKNVQFQFVKFRRYE